MASRRSSRLSANLSNPQDAESPLNGPSASVSAKKGRKRKGAEDANPEEPSNDGFAIPSTPKRKKAISRALPSTPTLATASMMAVPGNAEDLEHGERHPRTNRPVNPLLTNAPLMSPETSRVIINKPIDGVSPVKGVSSHAKATTGNVLEDALAHLLKTEPLLRPVVEKHHCQIFSPEGLAEEIDPFNSLASGIISQQVSGAAARSIKAKFVALFNPNADPTQGHAFPTPSQVAASDIPTLRTAGLSQRKAEYIKGLAEKFASGELSTEMLLEADYEEVLEKLTAVRGLGRWSVEMFACFGLKRMDVFSTGDLGVQRGMAALMGKDVSKLKAKGGGKWKYMSEKEMIEISDKFTPYRSVFMWYMWRVEDVDVTSLYN